MTAHPSLRGDVAVLVVAAGSGVRLGPGVPKALRTLAGVPLLVHAIRRVNAFDRSSRFTSLRRNGVGSGVPWPGPHVITTAV